MPRVGLQPTWAQGIDLPAKTEIDRGSPRPGRKTLRLHGTIARDLGVRIVSALYKPGGIAAAITWTTVFKQRENPSPRDPMPDHQRVYDAIQAKNARAAHKAMYTLVDRAFLDTKNSRRAKKNRVSNQNSKTGGFDMIRLTLYVGALALVTSLTFAQGLGMKPIEAPPEPSAIPLGTGGVEGAMAPESWVTFNGQATARNIQQATLTPVLPDRDKATGAAVVVAPGGGFLILSMENEGWPVARWLADRGIAAFVLKYRLRPTPASLEDFQKEMVKMLSDAARSNGAEALKVPPDAIADAEAALRLVRARATEWGVDTSRIGMLGFSAGAVTTLSVALKASPETMPAFIAPIYGPMNAVTVPAAAPPMFAAMAADDPLFGNKGFDLISNWEAARKPVELHLYQKGGHGFGMGRPNTTTQDWLTSFYHWLDMNGVLKKRS
jgi:acetyl esterase/lipase